MTSTQKDIKKAKWWKIALVVLLSVFVVISCSITIDSIDQPDSVEGGETFNTTLHITIETNDARSNAKFMVALLVPKVWNSAENASISFTSSITSGTQKMSAIPPGVAAPQSGGRDWPKLISDEIGNGGNLLPGWEWVAFYSDAAYSVVANDKISVTVNIAQKVSLDNLSFKIGYVVANSSDGLSDPQYYASAFPGCFRVFGQGDLLDYCNPQLGTVDPLIAADNDILTLGFDGGIIETALGDADEIYLCLKGVTVAGDTLNACRQSSETQLKNYAIKKWRIDLWPRSFFHLEPDQSLASLVYYYTDKTGNIKVGKDGTAIEPFIYTFKCQ